MAKSHKTKKTLLNSTTKRPPSNKPSAERKSNAAASSGGVIAKPVRNRTKKVSAAVCACCDCAAQSSGGVWTCEDGICVYIPKPSYYSVLVSDPNFVLPYWSRPTDLGLNCPATPTPVPLGAKKVARSKGRKSR